MLPIDWEVFSLLSPNGIQAVLFDVDGTLRANRPSSVHAFLDHAAALGLADSPERRHLAIRWTHAYWAQSADMLQDAQIFKGQEEQFWVNYARRHLIAFGCPETQAAELAPEMQRYMREVYRPVDTVLPEVYDTLDILRAAGFRLAVVTNRTQPCDDYLQTLKLGGYFDFALVAGAVSYWKPQPEIFEHALQRLGLQPEQAIYVGDNYYADVLGARRAGLRPVLIDPDGLFPDAGCATIGRMDELSALIAQG